VSAKSKQGGAPSAKAPTVKVPSVKTPAAKTSTVKTGAPGETSAASGSPKKVEDDRPVYEVREIVILDPRCLKTVYPAVLP
jgi:hypothetical protein